MGGAKIVTRRRKWTPEQKATLLAEVEAKGGRVWVNLAHAPKRRGVRSRFVSVRPAACSILCEAGSGSKPLGFPSVAPEGGLLAGCGDCGAG